MHCQDTLAGCAVGAVIRLAMDQLLWAPIFISTFLASLLTLEVCHCLAMCRSVSELIDISCIGLLVIFSQLLTCCWKQLGILTVVHAAATHVTSYSLVSIILPRSWEMPMSALSRSSTSSQQALHTSLLLDELVIMTYTLQGKSHEVKSKLRNDLKPTVIANWKLWVPAQFVNFRLVPPHLQVSEAHRLL